MSTTRKSLLFLVSAALVAAAAGYLLDRPAPGQDGSSASRTEPPGGSAGPRLEGAGAALSVAHELLIGVRAVVGDRVVPLSGVTLILIPRPPGSLGSEEAAGTFVARERLVGQSRVDGQAKFAMRFSGEWKVRAITPGYLGQELVIRVPDTEPRSRVDLELTALGRIRGEARTKDGSPVPGAQVELRIAAEAHQKMALLDPSDTAPSRRVQQLTGDDGTFDFPVVLPGVEVTVVVLVPRGGRRVEKLLPLTPGEVRNLSLELDRPTSLTGRVPGPWDVEAARITVECFHRTATGLTAEQRVPVLPDGTFRLEAISPGEKRLVYLRRLPASVTFGFLNAVAVAEASTDVGGIPVSNSTLRISVLPDGGLREARQCELTGSLVLEDEGRSVLPFATPLLIPVEAEFVFVGLPPGRLLLTAVLRTQDGKARDSAYSAASYDRRFDGSAGRVDLVLAREATATQGSLLVIVDPPAGVEPGVLDARITLLRDMRVIDAFGKRSEGSAQFRMGPHSPGRYRLLAVANGHQSAPSEVEIKGGETVVVRISSWTAGGGVSGKVVDGAGAAVIGALVIVLGPKDPSSNTNWPVYEVLTDEAGAFAISSLPLVDGLRLHAESTAGVSSEMTVDARHRLTNLQVVVGRK